MGNEEKWLSEAKSTAKKQAEMFVDELIKVVRIVVGIVMITISSVAMIIV